MNWPEAFALVGGATCFAAMIIAACYFGSKNSDEGYDVRKLRYSPPSYRRKLSDVTWYSKTEYHTPKGEESGQAV